MNIVVIMGHLGRDPEVRYTPSGLKVTSFTIAANVYKAGKNETIWYRVTLWGDQFDKMVPHLKKGTALVVIGELTLNEYTDKEGKKQISLEVTANMLKFPSLGRPDGQEATHGQTQQAPKARPAETQTEPQFSGTTFGSQSMPSSAMDDMPF